MRCPHIGYLHSGFEKLGEHLNYNQYVTIVDRMDYISPISNELAGTTRSRSCWASSSRRAASTSARSSRELVRIQRPPAVRRHVGPRPRRRSRRSSTGSTQREKIYDIVEYTSGQRFHTSYTRVGGVLYDVNDDWVDKVRDFVKGFRDGPRRPRTAC